MNQLSGPLAGGFDVRQRAVDCLWLGTAMEAGHHGGVANKVRNLHTPIRVMVNNQECRMLTIGYVARALGRSTWTVKYWQRLSLLPPAPFVQHPNDPCTRRRLYPEPFVDAVHEIAGRGYLGVRLDRGDWKRFHDEIMAAHEVTVAPLLRPSGCGF